MKTKLTGLIVLTFLTLCGIAVAAEEDDRIALTRTKGTPMGAIGMLLRLDADGAEAGTGFLVSSCHVLTAARETSSINASPFSRASTP